MAAVAKQRDTKDVKLYNFSWTGKDKSGKTLRGEVRAGGEHLVLAQLRRQGIQNISVKKVSMRGGKKITDKDAARQAIAMSVSVPESVRASLSQEQKRVLQDLLGEKYTYK